MVHNIYYIFRIFGTLSKISIKVQKIIDTREKLMKFTINLKTSIKLITKKIILYNFCVITYLICINLNFN